MYKLRNNNGKVNFLLCSGKDFVKNEMSISGAQHIIDHGEIKSSKIDGYPINVDDKWHFEGELMPTEPVPEESGSEPEEPKPKGGRKKA